MIEVPILPECGFPGLGPEKQKKGGNVIDWVKLLMNFCFKAYNLVDEEMALKYSNAADWIALRINKRLAGYEAMKSRAKIHIELPSIGQFGSGEIESAKDIMAAGKRAEDTYHE